MTGFSTLFLALASSGSDGDVWLSTVEVWIGSRSGTPACDVLG